MKTTKETLEKLVKEAVQKELQENIGAGISYQILPHYRRSVERLSAIMQKNMAQVPPKLRRELVEFLADAVQKAYVRGTAE